MSNIEAITFDLWQTLIMDNRELGRARTRRRLEGALEALTDAGYDFSYEQLQEAYRSCFRICRAMHQEEKDYTFDEQVNIFIDSINEDLSHRLNSQVVDLINYWYAEAFFEFPPVVASGAYEVVKEVREMGYRVGIISNTGMTPGRLFRRYLAQHDLLDFFHVLTFSDEVRLCKPSTEIFHMTLQELGTMPDKAVHLGDHIQNDVFGANRAGMRSVLLGTAEGQEKVAGPHVQILSLGELPHALEKASLLA
ncbi:MAG: HAD family hydrolase [Dehalococcoidia bacterium]|jgi:putative hydrolase of the HAD superfamily|nr:HAD family hydrolase [Dehalococcoidia bacterium]